MDKLKVVSLDRWESVDDLQEVAAAKGQTPPLFEGVPKQWLPGFIRWPIRVFMVPFVLLDLGAQWVAKKIVPPPFKQVGKCKQRGNCCHYILMPQPKGILEKVFYFWHTQVNGFYLRRQEPVESEGNAMVVMGCRYLQKNGKCGHYRLRPMFCRQWPRIEYFGFPRILKGCGFRAELKKPAKKDQ
jgi:hypothetical protein